MDLREVGNLSPDDEFRHWWIATRFCYIDRALKNITKNNLNVLEVGCGTGQNLRYLRQLSPHRHRLANCTGIDLHLPAGFRPAWSSGEAERWSNQLPAPQEKFDVIIAMDVLEHIENDEAALAQWLEYLAPGGVVLITVPAFSQLWSYHDVLLGHQRRYTRKQLQQLAQTCHLKSIFLRYAFAPFFPAVYLVRKLRGRAHAHNAPVSTDLKIPPLHLNGPLLALGRLEECLGGNPCFGTSVVGIFSR